MNNLHYPAQLIVKHLIISGDFVPEADRKLEGSDGRQEISNPAKGPVDVSESGE